MKYAALLAFQIGCIEGFCAPFLNLGFDQANTNNIFDVSGGGFAFYGPAAEMLPGWSLRTPVQEVSLIGYNAVTAGLDFASLYDQNVTSLNPAFTFPTDVKYSLGLWPGPDTPYTLSQLGDIPAGARSIRFMNYGGPLELRANNSVVPLVYVGSAVPGNPFNRINVFGDISQFAGQTVALDFTTIRTSVFINGIDSISFSPEAIPEPSTWVLLAVGMLGLLARRKLF